MTYKKDTIILMKSTCQHQARPRVRRGKGQGGGKGESSLFLPERDLTCVVMITVTEVQVKFSPKYGYQEEIR